MPLTLAVESAPISSLVPWPGNPRTHDLDKLRESLRLHGQYRPLVVQAGSRRVIAGNGTLEAATVEGWAEIRITEIEVSDDEATRIMLADNRLSDLAGYDNEALISAIQSLPDLRGTAYDEADLTKLIAELSTGVEPFDPMDEWHGLPPFDQHDLTSFFHVVVHFKDDEAAAAFFKLVGHDRVRTMWYPESDGHVGCETGSQYVLAERAADGA